MYPASADGASWDPRVGVILKRSLSLIPILSIKPIGKLGFCYQQGNSKL
jgi:hypothetical protein